MNIAIADDRTEDLQAAEDSLLRYFSARHPEVMKDLSVESFGSAEELLSVFEAGKFDMLLLDIYMEDMTGMEAAEAVRMKDDHVPIVFLTTSQEHLLEGYRVFASGYLLKPVLDNQGEFAHTMDHVFGRMLSQEKGLEVPAGGRQVDIPLTKIIYVDVDSEAHLLRFHLAGTIVESTSPYLQIQGKLETDDRFVECHHRIIINMDYVRRMDKEFFFLKDGSKVPISKRKLRETKAAYMHYLAHR